MTRSGVLVSILFVAGCSSEPIQPDLGEQGVLEDGPSSMLEDTAAHCRDGKDNDGDNKTDCEDQDCWKFSHCMDSGPDTTGNDAKVVDAPKSPDSNAWPDLSALDAPAKPDVSVSPDLQAPDIGWSDGPSSCTAHCQCKQGFFCSYSKCVKDPNMPIYCCAKPGCPPGRWCVTWSGKKSVCAESNKYKCKTACDCGPAHCCKNNICVKDVLDPWVAGGTAIMGLKCIEGVDPTYCCDDPECHAGRFAYKLNAAKLFRCVSRSTMAKSAFCRSAACYGTACNCKPGESCVDVTSKVPPGRACLLLSGGSCISNAVAESFYGYSKGDLLGCCKKGCVKGTKCEAGWVSGGTYAYTRVVGTCGSCGNGKCDASESPKTCPKDCKCGDKVCAPAEASAKCADCKTCGNGKCEIWEYPHDNNIPGHCPADCGKCGDGWCTKFENATTCPKDCKNLACADTLLYPGLHRFCGDGVCENKACKDPETCLTCPMDCGPCDKGWRTMRQFPGWMTKGGSAIWGASATNIYVVGGGGYIVHFDGAKVTPMYSGTTTGLDAVWGTSATDVYAAGGLLLHYDGKSWKKMTSSTVKSIYGIWGTSSTNIHAVGLQGAVAHYDGKAWAWSKAPISGHLNDVWGSSASEIWAVGSKETILRFNGKQWSASFTGTNKGYFHSVWGTSHSDVFAVGYNYGVSKGIIYHYDGNKWNPMTSGTTSILYSTWGTSPSNVYAAGYNAYTKKNVILRYQGTSWKPVYQGQGTSWRLWGNSSSEMFAAGVGGILRYDGNPKQQWKVAWNADPGRNLSDVWGSSPSDVFTVGMEGKVLHYDGKEWAPQATGVQANLSTVWGFSSTSVFALGSDLRCPTCGGGGYVLRYDGTKWSTHLHDSGNYLYGIWGTSESNIFAVGRPNDPYKKWKSTVLRWNGKTWTNMNATQDTVLMAVWGSSPSNVYAVGNYYLGKGKKLAGKILHYKGTKWTTVWTGGEMSALSDVWGTSATDVYAMGLADTVMHSNGKKWTPINTNTGVHLGGIWGNNPKEIYVIAGQDNMGHILRFNGKKWTRVNLDIRKPAPSSYTCATFGGIWGFPKGQVFVVGSQETIFHRCPGGVCP